jgi:hypothetical protein
VGVNTKLKEGDYHYYSGPGGSRVLRLVEAFRGSYNVIWAVEDTLGEWSEEAYVTERYLNPEPLNEMETLAWSSK